MLKLGSTGDGVLPRWVFGLGQDFLGSHVFFLPSEPVEPFESP